MSNRQPNTGKLKPWVYKLLRIAACTICFVLIIFEILATVALFCATASDFEAAMMCLASILLLGAMVLYFIHKKGIATLAASVGWLLSMYTGYILSASTSSHPRLTMLPNGTFIRNHVIIVFIPVFLLFCWLAARRQEKRENETVFAKTDADREREENKAAPSILNNSEK